MVSVDVKHHVYLLASLFVSQCPSCYVGTLSVLLKSSFKTFLFSIFFLSPPSHIALTERGGEERERERQTDRDRQTHSDRDRQRDRERDTERETHTERDGD